MPDKPAIAVTMSDFTTLGVEAACLVLEAAGFRVRRFPADGAGGVAMEILIRAGRIAGVLDFTTSELAETLVGGIFASGPDRLTAAALAGVPQVVVPGALDIVSFGPRDTIPARYQQRRCHEQHSTFTLLRTTPEELDKLGKEIAEKTSAANSPTAVLLPLKGLSALDAEGQPFWWPEADAALFQSVRNWIAPYVELIELDLHINDAAFAQACANKLLEMLGKKTEDR